MRQVLLRFNVADPWSLEPIKDVTGVGIWYAVIVGVMIWAGLRIWESRRTGSKAFSASRCVGPIAAVLVAWLLTRNAPTFLRENGIPVFGYGMMVFLGFTFGGWAALQRAKRIGVDPDYIWDLLTWVFIAGIGGARLFYLVQKHDSVYRGVQDTGDFFFASINLTDGGLVLLGGVIAVALAVILFGRIRRISPLLLADIVVPSFFVGLGFGRLGCLMNGCCYGDRCDLPWAIHFPKESAAWGALMNRGFIGPEAITTYGLHPTQIYSSLTAFLLAALTAAFFRRRPFDGSVLVLGMLLYSIQRFLIEFLRGDEFGQLGTMFTVSQWISFSIFVAGLVLWAVLAGWGGSRQVVR